MSTAGDLWAAIVGAVVWFVAGAWAVFNSTIGWALSETGFRFIALLLGFGVIAGLSDINRKLDRMADEREGPQQEAEFDRRVAEIEDEDYDDFDPAGESQDAGDSDVVESTATTGTSTEEPERGNARAERFGRWVAHKLFKPPGDKRS